MNFSKLDTSLILALKENQDPSIPCLVVFIHTQSAIDSTATTVLEGFGISGITPQRDVFTATLSLNAVAQLSEQPWVKYLKLSHKLRFASGD